MKFLTIILFLITFCGIHGLHKDILTGIDVIQILTSKNISCDFHNFVKSTNDSDDDYKILINDLTKYCSTSESTRLYRLLCRMILIELEIGCLLPNNSRPIPIKYSIPCTSTEICSVNKITLINAWIWQKLTSQEKEEIGPTSVYLCPLLTSSNSTLQLARFFYGIAPSIRRADLSLENKDSVFDKIQLIGANSQEKRNNTNNGLFEQQDELSIDKNLKLSNQTIDKLVDLNKTDQVKPKVKNEGSPLGRAGEQPEYEQNNGRPKPKPFEVESVFKAKEDNEQNWVEGRHKNEDVNNRLRIELDNIPGMKLEHDPFIISQIGKRKSSLKLKLKKHFDINDNNDLSNNLITSFLIFLLWIIIIYLIFRNKNKVLGLVIEGCKLGRAKYRPRSRLGPSS